VPDDAPRPDFSERLHALRGEELRRLPAGARTVLHGGAAERWYFEWFDQLYPGTVERHVGVEYFAAEPTDLPDNVTWLRRTLGDIAPVADGEVDLVFAGQVIEHLWPDDVAGFLTESHRVLAPDGVLVLDSPNRRVTEQIRWLHPQHTCELTVSEVSELVRLAGFEIESIRGVLLGYDRERHVFLGLEDESLAWEDRAAQACDRPEDSFVWWLTARRRNRAPQRAELRARAQELGHAFRSRRCRALTTILPVSWGQDRQPFVSTPPGYSGPAVHGPLVPLDAGHWVATVQLRLEDLHAEPDAVAAHLDACCESGEVILGARDITVRGLDGTGRWTVARLEFDVRAMVMGLEVRVFAGAEVRIGAQLQMAVARVDDAPTGTLGPVRATANMPEPRTTELLEMLARRTATKITRRLRADRR
jgi:SAM-dependent methyltransferase